MLCYIFKIFILTISGSALLYTSNLCRQLKILIFNEFLKSLKFLNIVPFLHPTFMHLFLVYLLQVDASVVWINW